MEKTSVHGHAPRILGRRSFARTQRTSVEQQVGSTPLGPTSGRPQSQGAGQSSLWASLQHIGQRAKQGAAVAAALLALTFGAATVQAQERGVETRSLTDRTITLPLPQPVERPIMPLLAGHSVTFHWTEDIKNGINTATGARVPFPPGSGVTGYILEERGTNNTWISRDLGRTICLDNGLLASCTWRVYGVSPGLHVWRMRAKGVDAGVDVVSDPTLPVSKLVMP